MHNNQSSYSRWSWIIALILALILAWMYFTGKGPSSACCSATEAAAPTAAVTPMEEPLVVTEAFNFSASEYDYASNGDDSSINWSSDIDALKALLSGGISANGDDTSVILTGIVDSEEIKELKGLDASAFFGPDVSVDNQITVAAMAEPAPAVAPPAAKLFFNTGVHRLPAESATTLEPIITWLKNNPNAKAVISGFHDPVGNQASNQRLARNRAKSAYNALLNAGIEADRMEMRKPEVTEGGGDLSEARRVEVSIE